MGLGYALNEGFPLKDCIPAAKYGTLGLLRASDTPAIHAIYVEEGEQLPVAYGAKGIGGIASIPTAPATERLSRPQQQVASRIADAGHVLS